MMGPLQNHMRLQAQRALAYLVTTEIGTVTSYDPNRFMAKVELQPDLMLTGWLPVASPWIGNGWGLFAPPNIGDMVSVEFINGNWNSGVVVGRYWNLQQQPLAVPSGELWLVHANGQFIKLTNDGKLTLSDGKGASVILNGDGTITSQAATWNHTGDINVTGNLHATGTVTGDTDVVSGQISLVKHPHNGVQTGSGLSGLPQPA